MFWHLAHMKDLDVKIYYYDPGSLGRMFDPGYGNAVAWDVDLLGGTQSVILPNLLRGGRVNQFRQLNPGVIGAFFRERFDAVFVSGYISPSNWLVLACSRLFKSKLFYQSDTNILDVRRKRSALLKRAARSLALGLFLAGVDKFLVAGDKNRESYIEFGVGEKRLAWCPLPVDMNRYETARNDPDLPSRLAELRQKYQIPAEARVVAFCGKLIGIKRPQDLIEALRLLNRNNVYALLIGSGELEAALRQSLRAQDRVRVTGFVNQSQIPCHMLLADLAVMPSEWDPHPLVTTEFAMCGLPVVVSHFCGVWGAHDILRPGENGFVYPCGDIQELAARIACLLDDDLLRQKFGARSLELSREQSAEHAAKVVAALLQQI
jgi:glycosyltransferase involved in cell wall biosynthesis